MNLDEFAFFNRQLAEMLRGGLPLEGALRQLAATMRAGALREEIQLLEADLARGTPLPEALGRRRFPEFYTRMMRLGAQGRDLPGLLTMLADYYQRRHALWSRLQALLVYPALVLLAATGLSVFLIWLYRNVLYVAATELVGLHVLPAGPPLMLWLPLVWLVGFAALALLAVALPATRRWLRWRLPGFKEFNVAQFAAAMHLLIARGGNLGEALGLLRDLEGPSPAGRELARWRERLAAGAGQFAEFAAAPLVFPRLFVWLVAEAGADLAAGFKRAADLYQQRAAHQVEMMLYAALPTAVLALGLLILLQLSSALSLIVSVLNVLGGPE
jgi:type II secretory pathway component PulF